MMIGDDRFPWLHLSQHGLEGLPDIIHALALLQRKGSHVTIM